MTGQPGRPRGLLLVAARDRSLLPSHHGWTFGPSRSQELRSELSGGRDGIEARGYDEPVLRRPPSRRAPPRRAGEPQDRCPPAGALAPLSRGRSGHTNTKHKRGARGKRCPTSGTGSRSGWDTQIFPRRRAFGPHRAVLLRLLVGESPAVLRIRAHPARQAVSHHPIAHRPALDGPSHTLPFGVECSHALRASGLPNRNGSSEARQPRRDLRISK